MQFQDYGGLDQWFSTGDSFHVASMPRPEHLALSGVIFGFHTGCGRGCSWHLVGRGQECGKPFFSAQDGPLHRERGPAPAAVLRVSPGRPASRASSAVPAPGRSGGPHPDSFFPLLAVHHSSGLRVPRERSQQGGGHSCELRRPAFQAHLPRPVQPERVPSESKSHARRLNYPHPSPAQKGASEALQ